MNALLAWLACIWAAAVTAWVVTTFVWMQKVTRVVNDITRALGSEHDIVHRIFLALNRRMQEP